MFEIKYFEILKWQFCKNNVKIRERMNLLERTQPTILKIHSFSIKNKD